VAHSGYFASAGRPPLRRPLNVTLMLAVAALALAPWREARAYIDPNSAGPLYQFLFPFLIAAASALAALRRYIARLWNRLVHAVVSAVRGERAPAEQAEPTPPEARGDR
jgi:hypothetical protein